MTQDTIVLGGGPIGLALATELAASDHAVTIVDDARTVRRARRAGLTTHESTLETVPALDRSATTVVAATASDARNLLLARTAVRAFDTDDVVALVNDPANRAAFDDAEVATVCVAAALARATTDAVGEPEPPERQGAASATASADRAAVEPAARPTADGGTDDAERVRLRE